MQPGTFFPFTNQILIYMIMHAKLNDQWLHPIGGRITIFCCHEMFNIVDTNKIRFGCYMDKILELLCWESILNAHFPFSWQDINVLDIYLSYSSKEKTANRSLMNSPYMEVDGSAKGLLMKQLESWSPMKNWNSPWNAKFAGYHPYLYSSSYWCTLFMQSNMRTRLKGHTAH